MALWLFNTTSGMLTYKILTGNVCSPISKYLFSKQKTIRMRFLHTPCHFVTTVKTSWITKSSTWYSKQKSFCAGTLKKFCCNFLSVLLTNQNVIEPPWWKTPKILSKFFLLHIYIQNWINNAVLIIVTMCNTNWCTISTNKIPVIEMEFCLWSLQDYNNPDWVCLADFFAIKDWKIPGRTGIEPSDGSGSKIFTWIGSIFCCSGQVSHFWFGFGKFSLKIPFFYFSPFGSRKISLGQVKNYWGQRRVGFLFTAGQKYARVGSGPISNWTHNLRS